MTAGFVLLARTTARATGTASLAFLMAVVAIIGPRDWPRWMFLAALVLCLLALLPNWIVAWRIVRAAEQDHEAAS